MEHLGIRPDQHPMIKNDKYTLPPAYISAHAILASCSTSFSTYSVLFILFYVLFLILYICFLCDSVDDVPFEGDQEQVFEEENQQFGEEGKWSSPSSYSILAQ